MNLRYFSMPVVEGRPMFEKQVNLVTELISPHEGDYCVIGIPADDPNADWILQHKDVVEFNEEGDPIEIGQKAPEYPRRANYTRQQQDNKFRTRPRSYPVDDLTEVNFRLRTTEKKRLKKEEVPEAFKINDFFNEKGAYQIVKELVVKGDKLPLARMIDVIFPKNNLAVPDYFTYNPNTNLDPERLMHEMSAPSILSWSKVDIDRVIIRTPDDPELILNRIPYDYEKLDFLEVPQEGYSFYELYNPHGTW